MKTKIKRLTWSDILTQMFISIFMCWPIYLYLSETMPWYKAFYFSGIVFWFALGMLAVITLLYNIIDAMNKGD